MHPHKYKTTWLCSSACCKEMSQALHFEYNSMTAKWPLLSPRSALNVQCFLKIDCSYVLNLWPFPACTMQSIASATLSQWPHQRTSQKNRNDRLFIIAQPLCQRGKSIIKTRLTAKITAMSSIVLEQGNFFFPQGSLDQFSITLVQFAPHLKSHCLLELDLPDSFTQWMDSPTSDKKKREVLCEIAWGVMRFRNRQVPLSVCH